MSDANTSTPASQNPGEISIQIITQYIKDASFENPHAPESLVSNWGPPEPAIQISLAQQQVKDNTFESSVYVRIEAKSAKSGKMAFILDVHYGALVALVGVPRESTLAVLMVEVPKLIFPYLREVISDLTIKGGYPPLYLSPINFESIYLTEIKRLKDEHDKKQAGNA